MSIRSSQEIIDASVARIGGDTSDEAIAYIEDITDTLTDYSTQLKDSGEWKAKYEALDAEWRTKYVNRFKNTGDTDDSTIIIESENSYIDEEKEATIESLFE